MKFLTFCAVLLAALIPFNPVHLSASEIPPIPYDQNVIQKPNDEQIEQAEIAYYDNLSKELTFKAESLVGTYQGQCVVAVRNFLGVGRDEIQGMARNTKINSKDWQVGAIVVFRMSAPGHVGVALFADSQNYLWYWDSNGDWKGRGAIRKIKLDNPLISGYHITKYINI